MNTTPKSNLTLITLAILFILVIVGIYMAKDFVSGTNKNLFESEGSSDQKNGEFMESLGNIEAEGIFSKTTSPLVMNLVIIEKGEFSGESFVLSSKDAGILKKISLLEDGQKIKVIGTIVRNKQKITYPEGGDIVTKDGFDFIELTELE